LSQSRSITIPPAILLVSGPVTTRVDLQKPNFLQIWLNRGKVLFPTTTSRGSCIRCNCIFNAITDMMNGYILSFRVPIGKTKNKNNTECRFEMFLNTLGFIYTSDFSRVILPHIHFRGTPKCMKTLRN